MKIEIQAPWEVHAHLWNVIFDKVEKLENYYDKIIRADVFLKIKEHESINDKVVEIRMSVPGPYIFAEGVSDTYEKAVADAADKIKKQLLKRKDKLQNR